MYLPDVTLLHNLACLAKNGMLLVQERLRFFVGGIIIAIRTYFLRKSGITCA